MGGRRQEWLYLWGMACLERKGLPREEWLALRGEERLALLVHLVTQERKAERWRRVADHSAVYDGCIHCLYSKRLNTCDRKLCQLLSITSFLECVDKRLGVGLVMGTVPSLPHTLPSMRSDRKPSRGGAYFSNSAKKADHHLGTS